MTSDDNDLPSSQAALQSGQADLPFEQVDSRRLTGPNLLWKWPGAVLDVRRRDWEPGADPAPSSDDTLGEAIALWRAEIRTLLDALGWSGERTVVLRVRDGASLAISAPIDTLYAATEVNEAAWALARRTLLGEPADEAERQREVERLAERIADESKPRLLQLREAALRHGVRFLSDDDLASVGSGVGSLVFSVQDIPPPDQLDWQEIADVPALVVTGTNGKTTTVRLIAAMARAAGLVAGVSSTGGIWVGGELVEDGDFAGPGGARAVLRDRRVDLAVLEAARGGMLRRGLGTDRVDLAVITNVAPDHLGEFGIHDLNALTQVKLIPARAARRLVLCADDPQLRHAAAGLEQPITWYGLDPDQAQLHEARCKGGTVLVLEDGELVRYRGPEWRETEPYVPYERVVLADAAALPMALGGAAHHNIQNALAAAAAATELGLPIAAIRSALGEFGRESADNPGRLNRYRLGDAELVIDFAHNPHGLDALLEAARRLQPRRLLVVLGQAGDRDDEAIADLARTAWRHHPDQVVVKRLDEYRRGREAGEVEALLDRELRALGAGPDRIVHADGEHEALQATLEWLQPGDLALQLVHSHRDEVKAVLERLVAAGWRAGDPLGDLS